MEAESYDDSETASFIHENFIPLGVHIKENPKNFRRFNSVWTPAVLVMDPDGDERYRLEGYLSNREFRAFLEMGLARVSLMRKDWPGAESRYSAIIDKYPGSKFAPEAVYYRGVSRYGQSHNHHDLTGTADELGERFADSIWSEKADPWRS